MTKKTSIKDRRVSLLIAPPASLLDPFFVEEHLSNYLYMAVNDFHVSGRRVEERGGK